MVNWQFHGEEDKGYTPPKNENTKFNWGTIPVIALLIVGAYHYFGKESEVKSIDLNPTKPIYFNPANPIDLNPVDFNRKNFQENINKELLNTPIKQDLNPKFLIPNIGDDPIPSIPNIQNPSIKNNSINTSFPNINIIPKNSILNQEKSFDSKIKIDGSLDYE